MNLSVQFVLFFIIAIKYVEIHSASHITEAEIRRLFKLKRASQLATVKRIRSLDTEGKQNKIITSAAEKIFTMMRNNRVILESSGFIPGESTFPEDENIRDALSNLLENTALMGDIVLRLPDISQSLLAKHNDWVILFAWSVQFSNQTKLLDKQTATLIELVSQEMNFTKRSDDYINPYRYSYKLEKDNNDVVSESPPVKKKKKTKDVVRGPRMTSRSMGEL